MKSFPCTSCGLCCNTRNLSPEAEAMLKAQGFPYSFGPDGFCEKYDRATRHCTVYLTRPLVCRVDETKPPNVSTDDWHGTNARFCNAMIRKVGLPDTFLVVEVLDPDVWND